MNQLNSALNSYFRAPAPRKPADPAYVEFRAYCKAKGLTYKIDRHSGFIDFSDGVSFGHYGDWVETLSGHRAEVA